jgi:chromodomain-helicase-DNA-binding protein 1
MSTSPDPSPVNGHVSLSTDGHGTRVADATQSDSDLSDAQPAGIDAAAPESPDAVGSPDEAPEFAADGQEESSDSSDHDALDDNDFDVADSPASVPSNDASDHAASASVRTAVKRKAAQVLEDEYMRENPELYGLRRSV